MILILLYLYKPEDLFSEFDERPLGTASLAQVHRAKLKDSNQEVAVKVQHRYVKNHSMGDIYTCEFLVHTVKFFFPQFEFMWLAEVSVKTKWVRDTERLKIVQRHILPCIYCTSIVLGNEEKLATGIKLHSRRKECRKNI